jgi:hypothetical protein
VATRASWEPLDLSGLAERLEQAQALLEQAAALATAQDAARLASMADLQDRLASERERGHGGHARRRRYR